MMLLIIWRSQLSQTDLNADGYYASQAVTDAPNVNFVDALLAAYPEAKVVLSVRDPDKWLASSRSPHEEFDSSCMPSKI